MLHVVSRGYSIRSSGRWWERKVWNSEPVSLGVRLWEPSARVKWCVGAYREEYTQRKDNACGDEALRNIAVRKANRGRESQGEKFSLERRRKEGNFESQNLKTSIYLMIHSLSWNFCEQWFFRIDLFFIYYQCSVNHNLQRSIWTFEFMIS